MADKKEKNEKNSVAKEKEKTKSKVMDEEEETDEEETKENTEEEKKTEDGGSGFWFWVLALGLIVLLIFAYNGMTGNSVFGDDSESATIKIGFMGPLSGDAASYGHGIKRGVELALKDSGLENVEVIYEDTKCDGKEAVTAASKLINVDGVSAIIGEVCSGATLAAAPIAQQAGVVMITASSTSPELSKLGDYIFRTVPSDQMQGEFAAKLLIEENVTNVSILYGNEEYGLGFKEVLKKNLEENGGFVVAEESFERGSVDMRTQLSKLRAKRPQAIFIISNSPDSSVAALKQIKQLGIKTKVYGSEGLKAQQVEQTEAAEGLVITSVSSGTTQFATKYMNSYGLKVEPFAPQAYDAFNAVTKAISEGAKTNDEIKNKVSESDFRGISGQIDFDENGDVSGNYEVFDLKNGTFVKR